MHNEPPHAQRATACTTVHRIMHNGPPHNAQRPTVHRMCSRMGGDGDGAVRCSPSSISALFWCLRMLTCINTDAGVRPQASVDGGGAGTGGAGAGAAPPAVAASSAFAMTLMKETEEDTLLASTATHEIISIPLSLPVELTVKKAVAARKHLSSTSTLIVASEGVGTFLWLFAKVHMALLFHRCLNLPNDRMTSRSMAHTRACMQQPPTQPRRGSIEDDVLAGGGGSVLSGGKGNGYEYQDAILQNRHGGGGGGSAGEEEPAYATAIPLFEEAGDGEDGGDDSDGGAGARMARRKESYLEPAPVSGYEAAYVDPTSLAEEINKQNYRQSVSICLKSGNRKKKPLPAENLLEDTDGGCFVPVRRWMGAGGGHQ